MISWHNHKVMDDAGDLYTVIGWAFQRGIGHPVENYNKSCRIFSTCAGAGIYRREVLKKIGLFDEMHFAYLEDVDVGYRARIEGYRNEYCPTAQVYHIGSATSGSTYNDFKVKLTARNSVYLNYKNMPSLQLAVNFFPLLAGFLVKYSYFKRLGYGKAYRDGVMEGLRTVKKCRKVPFQKKNLMNYLLIEWELVINTFRYARACILRRKYFGRQ